MIKYWKEENVGSIQAWADVMNNHIDSVIAENEIAMLYAAHNYRKDGVYIVSVVLYSKIQDAVYVMYDTEDCPQVSKRAENLIAYAVRQYERLNEKSQEW